MIARTAFAVLVLLAAACGNERTGPAGVARFALVNLTSPNSADGAIAITLRGPGFSSIQSASSAYLVYSRPGASGEVRVIVVGNIRAGPLLQLRFARPRPIDQYAAAVDQVASPDDTLRSNLAGYTLAIAADQ